MPNPIEVLLDPISLAAFSIYGALILLESILPGRPLPEVPGWKLRGGLAIVAYFYLSTYLPLVWDETLAAHRLLDLTALGTVGGVAVGLVLFQVAVWAWHRTMHASKTLWRVFHQMHHSAERLDTLGAFYFSPFDMAGWTLLGSLVLALGIGVEPRAATIILLINTFLAVFQHTNIHTPRWLGFLVQRPESHTLHHGRDLHAYNYADLPLIDMLFGTFRNPEGFEVETGFEPGASARVWDMLTFSDVSVPKAEEGSAVEGAAA